MSSIHADWEGQEQWQFAVDSCSVFRLGKKEFPDTFAVSSFSLYLSVKAKKGHKSLQIILQNP